MRFLNVFQAAPLLSYTKLGVKKKLDRVLIIYGQRQPDPVHTKSGKCKTGTLIFSVTFTVHTNPQEKGPFPTDALQTGGI